MIRLLLWLMLASSACAQTYAYVLHIYSPWASDATKSGNRMNAIGGFSDWSASTNTNMTDEGNGYFSYTIKQSLSDWWTMTFKTCPAASDQNCTGGATWSDVSGTAITPKVAASFGKETEIWIIPDASAAGYHITLMPPFAKIVWFKSPWGNKSLPRLLVGSDTLRMNFGADPAHCGWFWGALRGSDASNPQVRFLRPHTHKVLPDSGNLDLSSALASSDSAWVDGTTAPLAAAASVGTAGTCFDTNYTIHALNGWESDTMRRSLPLYLNAGNLLGNGTAMNKDAVDPWWVYSFAPGTKYNNETVRILSYYPTSGQGALYYKGTHTINELFPAGEYEVWLITSGDSNLKVVRAPVTPRLVTVRNPWVNTVPKLLIDNDTLSTKSISDTCGWYRATIWDDRDAYGVSIKQALGYQVYSSSGLDTSSTPSSAGVPISLDSLFREGNQAWITENPYPTGLPKVASTYMGPPGDCPNRNLAVMMFDHNAKEADFEGVWGGQSDSAGWADPAYVCPNINKHMVKAILDSTINVPEKNPDTTTFPKSCTAVTSINTWFKPQNLDSSSGTVYTNATCYNLPLTMDDEGYWGADYAADLTRNIPGFFPLDDWKYLDSAQKIKNVNNQPEYYSDFKSWHNYSFTMHVNARFNYVPGQRFEFRGDDDVWVFINNKLVVDIGGVHGAAEDSVDLDTLGLTAGKEYPFHIFYAERNCCGSNFKMRTSIELHTNRTYYPLQTHSGDSVSYSIYQIIKEKGLSCDFTSTAKADTTAAPSNFYLSGPQFPSGAISLKSGVNYGGIRIYDDYTGFTIDTAAIVQSRLLAPGTYELSFTNSADASLTGNVSFSVPTYPLPTIIWTDSLWNPITPDTVKLSEWAFVPYAVHVEARYIGVKCPDCVDQIQLRSSDSLQFLDASNNRITSVTLDSGRATFYVMGLAALDSAKIHAYGASVQNELWWKNIKFKEPPVPFLRYAQMFDRNGDGVADSLALQFNKALIGKDRPDSVQWRFADTTGHFLDSNKVKSSLWHDSLIVVTGDSLAKFVFTGNVDGTAYQGSLKTWFTYIPTSGQDSGRVVPFEITGAIEDHVAPIVLSAEMATGKTNDSLFVYLSETVVDSTKLDSLFELRMWRSSAEVSSQVLRIGTLRKVHGTKYVIVYSNAATAVPTVGDSVRLTPSVGHDPSGNAVYAKNPFVRITGRQRSLVESQGLVEYDPATAPDSKASASRIRFVPLSQSLENVIQQEGVPGYLVRFDLANVVESSTLALKPSQVSLTYETWYYSSLGGFVNHAQGTVACTDSLFQGDCTKHPGNLFIGWNLRSSAGRLVGTGAYVSELHFRVQAGPKVAVDQTISKVWGVRRKK